MAIKLNKIHNSYIVSKYKHVFHEDIQYDFTNNNHGIFYDDEIESFFLEEDPCQIGVQKKLNLIDDNSLKLNRKSSYFGGFDDYLDRFIF